MLHKYKQMLKRLNKDTFLTEIKDGQEMEMETIWYCMPEILMIKKLTVKNNFNLGFVVDMKSQGITKYKI